MKERILNLIEEKNIKEIKIILNEMNSSDIAEVLNDIEGRTIATIFRLMNKDKAVEVFAYLDVVVSSKILEYLSDKEAVALIDEMPADDATDILEEMPANIVDKILKKCSVETRKDINRLLNYKEDSAGSIMTVEYAELKEDYDMKTAIKVLKSNRDDYETINTCFIINNERVLVGKIEIVDLLFCEENCKISDIVNKDLIYVHTDTDQEIVASYFQKYDITIMPVVDSEKRLVGIITIDDVMDVVESEATEDMKKMAAIIPVDKPYDKTSVFELFKARIPWLLLLMISATFTGSIISSFESQLSKYTILTAFIPMLMDTGGNAGGQSSVSVIRAISLNDIKFKDFFKVIFKEFRVALLGSLIVGVCNFFKMLLIDQVTTTVALVVCLTLMCTVLIAKIIGGSLPLIAKKIGFDPAVMASPFITTIVDACSLLVYFNIATLVLNI